MTLTPPPTMTGAERKAYRKLARQLVAAGLDPAPRAQLLADFVLGGARISELRAHEARSKGQERERATRALTTLTAERRRAHAQLFNGARKPSTVEDEVAVTGAQGAADEAWRAFYHSRGQQRTVAELEATYLLLRVQFGEPSWSALVDEDPVEAEAAVRAYNRARRQLPK